MIDIANMLEKVNDYSSILIAFFLWRIASHLKTIRKHIAGKMLFDIAQSCVQNYTAYKQKNTHKEVKEDETKNS